MTAPLDYPRRSTTMNQPPAGRPGMTAPMYRPARPGMTDREILVEHLEDARRLAAAGSVTAHREVEQTERELAELDRDAYFAKLDAECTATLKVGPAHDPYATGCDQPAGHTGPHEGPHPIDGAGRARWTGGGYAAGDPLPVRWETIEPTEPEPWGPTVTDEVLAEALAAALADDPAGLVAYMTANAGQSFTDAELATLPEVEQTDTLERRGYMTRDAGVWVRLDNGAEFTLTIQQVAYPGPRSERR